MYTKIAQKLPEAVINFKESNFLSLSVKLVEWTHPIDDAQYWRQDDNHSS